MLGIHLTQVLLKTRALQEAQYVQLQGLPLSEVIEALGLGPRLVVLRTEAAHLHTPFPMLRPSLSPLGTQSG